MGILESIRMALGALRANLLRSALTLVGMIIGVLAVIASVTAVEVIDVYFNESIKLYGTSTFSIERYEVQVGNRDEEVYHPPITYEEIERLRRMLSADLELSIMEDFDWVVKARHGTRETEPNLQLYGADSGFLDGFGFEMAQGRGFTAQDIQYGRPVAILGAPVAEELFPNESPLGKEVRIGRVRLEVIGVLEEKGSFLGFDPDSRVYAPVSYLYGVYGEPFRNIAWISVGAPSAEQLYAAQDEVISHMRVIRKVRAGEPNNFAIETNDSVRGTFDQFTATLTMAGAGIGLISLLAAGIGIMNIMLVSVTERTREIGIRKSIGAKKRDIMRQFLLEAIVLCQIGGLIGIGLGALLGNLTAVFFEISAAFPWDWAIIAVVGVTIIAVVFGGYPAFKAARLDPIESLRYE